MLNLRDEINDFKEYETMSIKKHLQELDLQASIDTVMIRTEYTKSMEESLEGVTSMKHEGKLISLKINPSTVYAKYIADLEDSDIKAFEVMAYSQYQAAIKHVLKKYGIFDFFYKRIDFRFDSYTTTFQQAEKLNRALILCYYTLHHTDNIYHTKHLITDEDLNDCYKASTREIESYNKIKEESDGTVLVRLEFRSVNQHKTKNAYPLTRPEELAAKWKSELAECPAAYTSMTQNLNQALVDRYYDNRALYPTINEFLRHNIHMIYTSKQMDDLLSKLGVAHPEQKRWNFLKRNKGLDSQFFSEKDMEEFIKYLTKQQKIFFSC